MEIDRRSGIGGSEAAATCNLSPWQTAYDVWLVKTGRMPDFEGNLATRIGLYLEAFIAQEYSNTTGRTLIRGTIWRHPKYPWVIGSPDYLIQGEDCGLELKFTGRLDSEDWGQPGSDAVPISYLCQCMQYMEITGLPQWDLAVMAGSQTFRIYHLTRDDELIGLILDEEERLWNDHILTDIAPEIDNAASIERYLRYRYEKQLEQAYVKGNTAAQQWSDTLQMVKAQLEPLEELKKRAEAELKLLIGESAGIEGEGFKHSWKQAKDGQEVNWEAVARDLHAPPEIIQKHTSIRPGSRRFLPKWIETKGE